MNIEVEKEIKYLLANSQEIDLRERKKTKAKAAREK
jgi:hypothetical protein